MHRLTPWWRGSSLAFSFSFRTLSITLWWRTIRLENNHGHHHHHYDHHHLHHHQQHHQNQNQNDHHHLMTIIVFIIITSIIMIIVASGWLHIPPEKGRQGSCKPKAKPGNPRKVLNLKVHNNETFLNLPCKSMTQCHSVILWKDLGLGLLWGNTYRVSF